MNTGIICVERIPVKLATKNSSMLYENTIGRAGIPFEGRQWDFYLNPHKNRAQGSQARSP